MKYLLKAILATSIAAISLAASHHPSFNITELYDMTDGFLQALMYPACCKQSDGINSTILSDDIRGRVDITRDFVGNELNTAYIFGLWCETARSNGTNIGGYPFNYTLTEFVGHGNMVSATALIWFRFSNVDAPQNIQAYFTFNAQGQINQYDIVFKLADWLAEYVNSQTTTDPAVLTTAVATEICDTAAKYCTGENAQYESHDACMTFITTGIPFGEAWQSGMNTLVCRAVHQYMVPLRPSTHCSHIGKTGGGYCTDDRKYTDYITTPFYEDPRAFLRGVPY